MFRIALLLAGSLAVPTLAASCVATRHPTQPVPAIDIAVQCPLNDVAFLQSVAEADIVDCLAEALRRVEHRWNHGGIAPLHAAAVGGSTDVIGIFLRDGADANARTEGEHVPLHYAAAAGQAAAVTACWTLGPTPALWTTTDSHPCISRLPKATPRPREL